eukprot:CAMPEP_0178391544 /NCGR_PEP_ID=MMETSP0689_2-20121128/11220_1 /TAXON_ID=160604 /ORGANISM="Amphidinium massartii, Strain CS-259" /LENGTH=398 /DNA_ID=CAMNT_0020012095 /DNA_START=88 /DNA_END=1280 /DNA_ORIENTATION=-
MSGTNVQYVPGPSGHGAYSGPLFTPGPSGKRGARAPYGPQPSTSDAPPPENPYNPFDRDTENPYNPFEDPPGRKARADKEKNPNWRRHRKPFGEDSDSEEEQRESPSDDGRQPGSKGRNKNPTFKDRMLHIESAYEGTKINVDGHRPTSTSKGSGWLDKVFQRAQGSRPDEDEIDQSHLSRERRQRQRRRQKDDAQEPEPWWWWDDGPPKEQTQSSTSSHMPLMDGKKPVETTEDEGNAWAQHEQSQPSYKHMDGKDPHEKELNANPAALWTIDEYKESRGSGQDGWFSSLGGILLAYAALCGNGCSFDKANGCRGNCTPHPACSQRIAMCCGSGGSCPADAESIAVKDPTEDAAKAPIDPDKAGVQEEEVEMDVYRVTAARPLPKGYSARGAASTPA